MRTNLINELELYQAFNEQEEMDRKIILNALLSEPLIFERSELTKHITSSAWVVNPEKTKVLMAYHNIYDSWAWLGGHADGEEDLLKVALKEVAEESGLKEIKPLNQAIFSLEVLTVDGHVKKDIYVPSHLHLNITYLIEANEQEVLIIKEDENSDVAWFNLDEAIEASNEVWFRDNVYKKLNSKLRKLK
ncbi:MULTISPECIES: NUDIX hydrolase [Vagococcus]|uniref:Adenosylhomocysteinase n=1 Tax=Vagococcus fluvialis bH819 TaxID=1255619 RepID=A0A1X6WLF1_9ENTE|nr:MULTISPECIES: NUDIX hydrolase [Vagococcus]SLM85088.1 Adenosylhomocysteinase [Vagococcus fluvialis bH819]HCM88496.1 NUDIX domain-containing protein [Vagococcus sp.]